MFINIIRFFILITLLLVLIESSNNDLEAIKKLFEKDYIPVTVLLSSKKNQEETSNDSTISWKAYIPKYNPGWFNLFYRGKLSVPADYESPETSPKLTLYIRKMCNSSSPIWNIIALAGGPGQNSLEYINSISRIAGPLGKIPFCVHVLDHRGVGKTIPKLIEEYEGEDWIERIEEISKRTDFPLKTLTITNAAKDVLELAKYLKKSMPDSKLGLIGSSYGSMLAHRVLSINPNMFDVCIFDGYATFDVFSLDNDKGLILDCKDDSICKSNLGSNPENIRHVPSYLFERNFNECTEILHDFLEDNYKISTENEKKFLFQEYFNLFYHERGFHRLLIALIHHTWTCSDPEIYEKPWKNLIIFIKKEKIQTI